MLLVAGMAEGSPDGQVADADAGDTGAAAEDVPREAYDLEEALEGEEAEEAVVHVREDRVPPGVE